MILDDLQRSYRPIVRQQAVDNRVQVRHSVEWGFLVGSRLQILRKQALIWHKTNFNLHRDWKETRKRDTWMYISLFTAPWSLDFFWYAMAQVHCKMGHWFRGNRNRPRPREWYKCEVTMFIKSVENHYGEVPLYFTSFTTVHFNTDRVKNKQLPIAGAYCNKFLECLRNLGFTVRHLFCYRNHFYLHKGNSGVSITESFF